MLHSPRIRRIVYCFTLTLFGVYWTFYTPSNLAGSHGWNFIEVFICPVLAVTLLYPLLRRIAHIARRENIGSLADFIAARYGKSDELGVLVLVIVTIGTIFFISQQLKTLSIGWAAVTGTISVSETLTAEILFAALLICFAVFFGARRPTFTHRNPLLMNIVAADGVLKLLVVVMLAVPCGVYLLSHPDLIAAGPKILPLRLDGGFFMATFLVSGVVVCVPHIFQVWSVESERDEDLKIGRLFLPAYFGVSFLAFLLLLWAGSHLPASRFGMESTVLAVADNFLGAGATFVVFGISLFSAATMVAIATFSLSTMISNRLSLSDFMQRYRRDASAINVGRSIMVTRRLTITVTIAVACAFAYRLDSRESSTIGLLFDSVLIQLLPAIIAGVYWRRAHVVGAMAGIAGGFLVWAWLLAAPLLTMQNQNILVPVTLALSPGTNAFLQRLIVTLLVNVGLLVTLSLVAKQRLIDRIQAAAFIDINRLVPAVAPRQVPGIKKTVGNLKVLMSQFLGAQEMVVAFGEIETRHGRKFDEDDLVDSAIAKEVEQLLAGVIGTSLASSIVNWQLTDPEIPSAELVRFLDQTAQAIRANREMAQAALNNLNQGVCVVDRDFRIVAWNERYREIYDLDPADISVGISMAEIIKSNRDRSGIPAGETERYIRRRLRDVRVGIPHVFERRLPNGNMVRVIGLPLLDGRYVTSFTEIASAQEGIADLRQANSILEERVRLRTAELVEVNEALKRSTLQAERARASQARFLAAASHDLLQPLHAARLFLGALQEQAKGNNLFGDLARNADVSIETANRLLNALLNLSRLEVGGLRPEVGPVDANRLFDDLRREFAPVAKSRGLKLRVIATKYWVRSDEDLLRSILQNLVGNAVRYTEEGSVLIFCRKRGPEIIFEVRDSGPGIAKDSLETIFEEYVRLAHGRESAKGLGLGLSIVKRIADVLHHRVGVRSALGKGATFSVAVAAASNRKRVAGGSSHALVSLAGLDILCVEDDPMVRKSLEALLQRWGIGAVFANSVEEALNYGRDWDVVLTDYHFESGLNGLDLVEQMQSPAKSFALITANPGADVLERAEALHADVIRKPVAPATLRAFLSRAWLRKSGNV